MSDKTTAQICEEAIQGWKESQNFCDNKTIPLVAFSSFIYGNMGKKQRKKLEKGNPDLFKFIKGNIDKGKRLFFNQFCPKCDKENPSEAKFCLNCGEKLS